MKKNTYARLAAAAIFLVATNNSIAADGLTLNLGTNYSSGDYGGTDRTRIVSIPLSAKYRTGPVTMRLSVSWLSVTGTGAVVPSGIGGIGHDGGISSGSGSGGTPGAFSTPCDNRGGARKPEDNNVCAIPATTTTTAARRTEQGFGDIVAAATYHAIDSKGLILDITGKMKFATASESKGLGSGKNDYALQAEAEQAIGKGYINGGIGHKWLGDPPGVSLRDPWFGAIGAGIKLSGVTTVGVSYDYFQSARRGGEAGQEVSLYASQRLGKTIKLNGYIFKGLSDGSADWGAGIGLGYIF